ncbi:MAG: hypothetical protein R2755_06390 [Acidimicrobiales bacterium]
MTASGANVDSYRARPGTVPAGIPVGDDQGVGEIPHGRLHQPAGTLGLPPDDCGQVSAPGGEHRAADGQRLHRHQTERFGPHRGHQDDGGGREMTGHLVARYVPDPFDVGALGCGGLHERPQRPIAEDPQRAQGADGVPAPGIEQQRQALLGRETAGEQEAVPGPRGHARIGHGVRLHGDAAALDAVSGQVLGDERADRQEALHAAPGAAVRHHRHGHGHRLQAGAPIAGVLHGGPWRPTPGASVTGRAVAEVVARDAHVAEVVHGLHHRDAQGVGGTHHPRRQQRVRVVQVHDVGAAVAQHPGEALVRRTGVDRRPAHQHLAHRRHQLDLFGAAQEQLHIDARVAELLRLARHDLVLSRRVRGRVSVVCNEDSHGRSPPQVGDCRWRSPR